MHDPFEYEKKPTDLKDILIILESMDNHLSRINANMNWLGLGVFALAIIAFKHFW